MTANIITMSIKNNKLNLSAKGLYRQKYKVIENNDNNIYKLAKIKSSWQDDRNGNDDEE